MACSSDSNLNATSLSMSSQAANSCMLSVCDGSPVEDVRFTFETCTVPNTAV
eukprot:CAMPEP_0179854890 /NCGR_PEP_ID=MMETSP0982-20121206/10210_1 /TAXON_ID=483367 /ORGANISM="non described non described, Strain CCMP 2436" /LENGTH=51 /DNA_ID=CAMNT_0021740877 /DNA_START=42 /DNA_END=194 /DNA_ORIENTATION=+